MGNDLACISETTSRVFEEHFRAGQGLVVRNAVRSDMPAVRCIYAREVARSLATFEEVPPSIEEMLERRDVIVGRGLPYLVAVAGDRIAGYCYAAPYRSRSAYRATVEDSIYVAETARGHGVGRTLLTTLITQCGAGPWKQIVAVIGDSANTGSVALHRSLGFRHVGTLREVGTKFGRSVDTVLMQRPLGPSAYAAAVNRQQRGA